LVDKEGRFVNDKGEFIDGDGNLLTEDGDYKVEFVEFIDDETEVVIPPTNMADLSGEEIETFTPRPIAELPTSEEHVQTS